MNCSCSSSLFGEKKTDGFYFQGETRTRVEFSTELYLGLDGLGLADEELGERGVEAAAAIAEVDGVVGRPVERVLGPLDEAENNGVLFPRQELPHRVQGEPGGRRHQGQQQRRRANRTSSHCWMLARERDFEGGDEEVEGDDLAAGSEIIEALGIYCCRKQRHVKVKGRKMSMDRMIHESNSLIS